MTEFCPVISKKVQSMTKKMTEKEARVSGRFCQRFMKRSVGHRKFQVITLRIHWFIFSIVGAQI